MLDLLPQKKDSPNQRGSRDLSEVQCNHYETTGGKGSSLNLGRTSMTLKVLIQGQPRKLVDCTKLNI